MPQVYAIYDPSSDRVVGIYGTDKTVVDERRNMLATVDHPGEYWNEQAQTHPNRWQTPEALEFVFLDEFSKRSDRNKLVKDWRSRRFSEARSIARERAGRETPSANRASECPDRTDLSFVERVEQWVDLTERLFGGDMQEWIENSSDTERERVRRLLEREVRAGRSCKLAEIFCNALKNSDARPEIFSDPTPPTDPSGVPF